MTLVKLEAPLPNHSYWTRGGRTQSDADGIIDDVVYASQMYSDLLGAGCTAVPPSGPSEEDLPEPVA
jgi:hypothetical protein